MRTVLAHVLDTLPVTHSSYTSADQLIHCAQVGDSMYTLLFSYDPPRSPTLVESTTFCASIDLYTQLGIAAYQNSADTLVFERESDALLASMFLSDRSSYTVKMV